MLCKEYRELRRNFYEASTAVAAATAAANAGEDGSAASQAAAAAAGIGGHCVSTSLRCNCRPMVARLVVLKMKIRANRVSNIDELCIPLLFHTI